MINPYVPMVEQYRRAVEEGRRLPLGGFPPDAPPPRPAPGAPTVLLFSPHPDDECITGALPLRLLRQEGMRIVNVAVTQGSRKERQAGRWAELAAACHYLGFECIATVPGGLEKVNPASRDADPAHWQASVNVIAGILAAHRPAVVFIPHVKDANSTHVGTHHLVMDALQRLPPGFVCRVVTTEFWTPMEAPNLMIESTVDEVATLVAATSFHAGEVQRNPYHLTLPAWMQDNVRRGGELVGGQGGAAPSFAFCTLYGVYRWEGGALSAAFEGRRMLASGVSLGGLFTDGT
jgi:LmbE family N-acetylglucosaminyl deacetylase